MFGNNEHAGRCCQQHTLPTPYLHLPTQLFTMYICTFSGPFIFIISTTLSPTHPQQRGGGTYCFWCRSRRSWYPHCSLSALYLLNQWVDFDQTCTDTLLGGRKEVIRFWWPLVTPVLWYFQILTKTSLSAPYLLNQMTDSGQTSYIVTLGWFKFLIRFWWPWPNFQGHHTIKTEIFEFCPKKLVCTLSLEPNGRFCPNFIYCNVGMD